MRITERWHKDALRTNPKHRLEDTAEALDRSLGRVSEDLQLADWMRTDPRVERFEKVQDALDYVKTKKREMKVRL